MQVTPCPQGYQITANDSGNFLVIGDAGHGNSMGAIAVEFVPTVSFVGSLAIMGRVGGGPLSRQENKIGIPFATVPFRKIYLNGAVSDYSMSTAGDIATGITGQSLIQVPANGLVVALLVTCSAGSCTVYYRTLEGAGAP